MPPLPRREELPDDIRDLLLYQKQDVAHERFGRDAAELAKAIIAVRRAREGDRRAGGGLSKTWLGWSERRVRNRGSGWWLLAVGSRCTRATGHRRAGNMGTAEGGSHFCITANRARPIRPAFSGQPGRPPFESRNNNLGCQLVRALLETCAVLMANRIRRPGSSHEDLRPRQSRSWLVACHMLHESAEGADRAQPGKGPDRVHASIVL
jgi:hypothetical protein